jgi:hypothetical protein
MFFSPFETDLSSYLPTFSHFVYKPKDSYQRQVKKHDVLLGHFHCNLQESFTHHW